MYSEFRKHDIARHVESESARRLLALWQEIRSGETLPLFSRVRNAAPQILAPYLVKVSAAAGGEWRYAAVGTGLRHVLLAPAEVSATVSHAGTMAGFGHRTLAEAAADAAPTYAIHTMPGNPDVLLWERLVLPCREPDDSLSLLLLLQPLEYIQDMIRAVLDVAPSGILYARCVRNSAGAIIDAVCLIANKLAAELLDRPLDRLVPSRMLTQLPSFADDGIFERCIEMTRERKPARFEIEHGRAADRIWLSVAAVPHADGFTLSFTDVTETKTANRRLELAHAELTAAHAGLAARAAELKLAVSIANSARADLESEIECREMLEKELRRLALTDNLTGLASRSAIQSRGQDLAARQGQEERSTAVTLVTLDIDHFKQINDTWGHAAGDRVLAAVAGAIQAACRDGRDFAGRIGGEEFLIILEGTWLAAATFFAEKLRTAIEVLPIAVDGAEIIHVTASFGVAEVCEGEDFEQLAARCDDALYAAKRKGRNRVCLARPSASRDNAA